MQTVQLQEQAQEWSRLPRISIPLRDDHAEKENSMQQPLRKDFHPELHDVVPLEEQLQDHIDGKKPVTMLTNNSVINFKFILLSG